MSNSNNKEQPRSSREQPTDAEIVKDALIKKYLYDLQRGDISSRLFISDHYSTSVIDEEMPTSLKEQIILEWSDLESDELVDMRTASLRKAEVALKNFKWSSRIERESAVRESILGLTTVPVLKRISNLYDASQGTTYATGTAYKAKCFEKLNDEQRMLAAVAALHGKQGASDFICGDSAGEEIMISSDIDEHYTLSINSDAPGEEPG